VLASLWAVDDEATASLMVDFYRGLQAGRSPAAALRAAQLGRAGRDHPYHWAGFVMSGRG
jgi:CHAT domain-containing protein